MCTTSTRKAAQILMAEGFDTNPGRIQHAIRTKRCTPAKNSRGDYVYTPENLQQLRDYSENARPGRPKMPRAPKETRVGAEAIGT